MDVDLRIAALETRCALLEERVAQLEALLVTDWRAPIEWRLTPSEERVMGVLVARERASKEAIVAALYLDRGADSAEPKIVDVFICKIRRKLRPFGVEITTLWGAGFALADRQKYRCAA